MDSLERYLDEVCRGIAGGGVRRRLRAELRAHILDAVAEHQSAGLTRDAALEQALADFGDAAEVRKELEEMHGRRRLVPWLLERATYWKESRMKAKWMWAAWSHTMVALAIVLSGLFIEAGVMFVLPEMMELMKDGWLDPGAAGGLGSLNRWGMTTLLRTRSVLEYDWLILLGGAVVWGLFEWRVRSENKARIRMAAMGTSAVALGAIAFLMAAAMILPLIELSHPVLHRDVAEKIATQNVGELEETDKRLSEAYRAHSWSTVLAESRMQQIHLLGVLSSGVGQPIPVLETRPVPQITAMREASRALDDVARAYDAGDEKKLSAAMARYQEAYGRIKTPSADADSRPDHLTGIVVNDLTAQGHY
jgi:hypothetical protein